MLLVLAMAGQLASAETVTLQHNGLVLTANLVKVDEAWQDKPVLLITHGTLAHGRMEITNALQQVFKDRGFSSLSITLSLGISERSGMYDCAKPHDHQHTDAPQEIGVWRHWLADQGVDEIVLVGHSRGGAQTAWYLADDYDKTSVKGAILVAPGSPLDNIREYGKRKDASLGALLDTARRMVAAGQGDAMMEKVDFLYCSEASVTAASFVDYYSDDPRKDTLNLLKTLSVPTLVFYGSEDKVVADLDGKLAAIAEMPNIQLQVIDGADHFFRDLYAEDLADAAVEFLEAL
jgi:pimeloyl-ACP methyl ester carboxylesterase